MVILHVLSGIGAASHHMVIYLRSESAGDVVCHGPASSRQTGVSVSHSLESAAVIEVFSGVVRTYH